MKSVDANTKNTDNRSTEKSLEIDKNNAKCEDFSDAEKNVLGKAIKVGEIDEIKPPEINDKIIINDDDNLPNDNNRSCLGNGGENNDNNVLDQQVHAADIEDVEENGRKLISKVKDKKRKSKPKKLLLDSSLQDVSSESKTFLQCIDESIEKELLTVQGSVDVSMFPCRLCKMIFHSDHLLLHHMYKAHAVDDDQQSDATIATLPLDFSSKVKVKERPSSPSSPSSSKSDIKDVDKFSCLYCPTQFPTTSSLRLHLKQHHAGHEPFKLRKFLESISTESEREVAIESEHCEGTSRSYEGAPRLNEAASHLYEGASRLNKGASRLYEGSSRIDEGASRLNEGASRMSEGASRVMKDCSDRAFACDQCSMRFIHQNSLQKHLLHHARNNPHQCHVCKLKFAVKEQLSRHERSHKRLHTCAECDMSFSHQSELTSHQRIHGVLKKYRSENRPVIDSDPCSSENNSNDSSKGHEWTLFMITDKMNKIIERELKIEPDSPESSSSSKTASSTDEKSSSHSTAGDKETSTKCSRHKFHIRKRRLLESQLCEQQQPDKRRHLDSNTSLDSTIKSVVARSTPASPVAEIPKPNFSMAPNFMPFSQTDLHNLITKHFYAADESNARHNRTYTDHFSRCGIDGNTRIDDTLLPTHSSILRALKAKVGPVDHSSKRSLLYQPEVSSSRSSFLTFEPRSRRCDDCGVVFSDGSSSLAQNEAPRKCEDCSMKYHFAKRKSNVTSNNNEKPFRCKYCPMKFRLRHNCEKHMCAHIANTEYSPHTCGYCAASFQENEQLRRHLNIHPENMRTNECSICLLKLETDEALKNHTIKSHSGDQPFSCPCCKQSFESSTDLQHHQSAHTQRRPYSCVICNARFARTRDLKRHVLSHQDDNGQQYNTDLSSEDADSDDDDLPMELGYMTNHVRTSVDNSNQHTKSRRRKSEPVKRTAMIPESDEDDTNMDS